MPRSPTPITEARAPEAYDAAEVLAFALSGPKHKDLAPAEIAERIRDLFAAAGQRRHAACRELLERLTPLASASEDGLANAALLCHAEPDVLAEDIYALRAFAADPRGAAAIAEMQRYLAEAFVPESERELALDRAIADGQISFGVLIADREHAVRRPRKPVKERAIAEENASYDMFIADPKRMRTAKLAFNHFHGVCARRYEDFHATYWAAASSLHEQLLEAGREVRALTRLNGLVELGAPVGEATIGAYEELIEATTACDTGADLAEVLKTATVCPKCDLRLGASGHAEAAGAVLNRLPLSIEQQLGRLSSVAVRAILERSSDPRVERFLKVVQAAQISTLTQILDDDLVGYLRRFLLEARISALLEPILDHVQDGRDDDEAATRDSLEKLADVLHRAIRGAAPPADEAEAEAAT